MTDWWWKGEKKSRLKVAKEKYANGRNEVKKRTSVGKSKLQDKERQMKWQQMWWIGYLAPCTSHGTN